MLWGFLVHQGKALCFGTRRVHGLPFIVTAPRLQRGGGSITMMARCLFDEITKV